MRVMTAPITHVLASIDFSDASREALSVAVELARAFDASLTLLHVWEIPASVALEAPALSADVVTPIEEVAAEQLEAELARVAREVPGATAVLRSGAAWERILDVAREKNADLVVVGTHGRTGVRRALLGSVAEKVVRTCPVPVLTVRSPDR